MLWLVPGARHDLLIDSLNRGIHWRVLVNTPPAAKSIAKYMKNTHTYYMTFKEACANWKNLAYQYPDCLEVRECSIPIIHSHHAIRFKRETSDTWVDYGKIRIKYYAYDHTQVDNSHEHEFSSFSKYYDIYSNEFEFLWAQSAKH